MVEGRDGGLKVQGMWRVAMALISRCLSNRPPLTPQDGKALTLVGAWSMEHGQNRGLSK